MANNSNPLLNGIDFNSMSKLLGNMNMGQLSGMLNGMNLNQLMPMMSKMMGGMGGLGGSAGAGMPPGGNPGMASGPGLAGMAAAGAGLAGAAAATSGFRIPPHLAGHPTILALNTIKPFFPNERASMIDNIIKLTVILITINSIYPLKNFLARKSPKAGVGIPPIA